MTGKVWHAWDERVRGGDPAADVLSMLHDDELRDLILTVDGREFERHLLTMEALGRLRQSRQHVAAANGILHQAILGLRSAVDLIVATEGSAPAIEMLRAKLARAEEAARALSTLAERADERRLLAKA